MDLLAALLAVAATASAAQAPTIPEAAPASCPAPSAHRAIRTETVGAALNELLASEGLTQVASALPVIRPMELDGDSNTDEALVDVVAPELCNPVGQCETLVVRALPCGRLVAMGHGKSLMPLASRSRGWMDLVETTPVLLVVPIALRALRFDGVRYGS